MVRQLKVVEKSSSFSPKSAKILYFGPVPAGGV